MSTSIHYVQAAASSGVPSLVSWAADQEVLCALADADGSIAPSESRDVPPAGLLPSDSAYHLAAALRWAVSYTNSCEGLLEGGLRARVASAHPADVERMHGFVRELAEYEREPDAVLTTPTTFLYDGFGPARHFHCVFVEGPAPTPCTVLGADGAPSPWADHEPVGMALFHSSYSTWEGRTIYVEDVYITPRARRLGVGARLFKICARAARAAGAKRLQWSCLDWNSPALTLYERKLGAQPLSEWTLFRLDSSAIERIAVERVAVDSKSA